MITLILSKVVLCVPYALVGGSGNKEQHASGLEIIGMWVNLTGFLCIRENLKQRYPNGKKSK